MSFSTEFASLKKSLVAQHQQRHLEIPQALDFCSNDYLGFSASKSLNTLYRQKIENYPLGSTGSRLIHGQNQVFVDLENSLALRSGTEAAVAFPTGYMANLALFGALGKMNCHYYSDSRNHASIIDGMRLSGAPKTIFPHNDFAALKVMLENAPKGPIKFVVVESIYSMLGDFAPLDELLTLCSDCDAHLIVDEAHATGLFGRKGSGCGEAYAQNIFARTHTAGKALGVAGSWVSGSTDLKDLMINTARPFIYSTGMSYPQLLLMQAALEHWETVGASKIAEAQKKLLFLKNSLSKLSEDVLLSSADGNPMLAPILPLVVGDNAIAIAAEAKLKALGFHVKAVRPPTVPQGESLLRLTVPGQRTQREVEAFAQALENVFDEVKR